MIGPLYTVRIANTHRDGEVGEYVGRGSPLGNPFGPPSSQAIYPVRSKEEAIESYERWLHEQILSNNKRVVGELARLAAILLRDRKLTLRCFCAPAACHAEVIKWVLLDLVEEGESGTSNGQGV